MRTIFTVFLVLVFFSCPLTAGQARSATADGNVTVLIYHRFSDSRYPSTSVSRERFQQQMAWLFARGYRVIALDRLVDTLARGERVPDRAVVITIDDAYRSAFEVARPILRSFAYPYTVFVYVKAVEKGYGDFMSWDQLRRLKKEGVLIGNHSFSHARMNERPAGMGKEEYRDWISSDLVKSARLMMKRLGDSPRFFAIPYGTYNDVVLSEAKKAGYDAVLTQDPGSVSSFTDRFRIPREAILGQDWSTLGHFEKVVRRVDLPLKEFSPPPGPVAAPVTFSARVIAPSLYRPGGFEMYVSELGWQRVTLDGDRLGFAFAGPFRRKFNRVILKGRRRSGEEAIATWFIGPTTAGP